MKKILFTGGGTIGHVAVNVALIPEFRKYGYSMSYIGSRSGIEKEMIETISDVKYYGISSGKLRRYFSLKNFTDPFRVIKGIIESIIIMRKEKPNFIFSKGGFVSVPVCIAARILKIPSLLHESDLTPGLANKINIRFCKHIFTTFEETIDYLPKDKSSLIGVIVREDIYSGNSTKAYEFTGLNKEKPIILVMGGSLGSKIINEYIWNNLSKLLEKYQIIHLVGKDLYNDNAKGNGYVQYEFLNKELFDIFKIVDFSISRAGANSIYEFLALNIPSILIPLGKNQSRGDQIENANFFQKNNFSKVISEDELLNLDTKYFDDFTSQIPTIKRNILDYKKEKDIINTSTKFYDKIIDILED